MGSKGGGTNTTTTNSGPPQQVLDQYSNVMGLANNAANAPLQQYTGNLVAGFTPQQQQSFSEIQNAQGLSAPFTNSAAQLMGRGATPITVTGAMSADQIAKTLGTGQGEVNMGAAMAAGAPGVASPYVQQGMGNIQQGAGMIGNTSNYLNQALASSTYNPSQTGQYFSPYMQSAVAATQAAQNNQDAQQQQQLTGNAISQGAFGGDRAAVAAGILGGQQAIANNQTIANMENTGYQNALQTQQQYSALGANTGLSAANANTQAGLGLVQSGTGATNAGLGLGNLNVTAGNSQIGAGQANIGFGENQQQQQVGAQQASGWLAENAGNSMSGLGTSALNNQLTGANAELQSGTLQQQLNQEQLNVPYQMWQQQQAYPFQTTSWLSNLATGIGSQSGGTSATTSPAPSTASQLGGLGLAGLGVAGAMMMGQGGRVKRAYGGGFQIPTLPTVPDVMTSPVSGMSGVTPMTAQGITIPKPPAAAQQQAGMSPASALADYNIGKGAVGLYNALNPGTGGGISYDVGGAFPSTAAMNIPSIDMGATAGLGEVAPAAGFSDAAGALADANMASSALEAGGAALDSLDALALFRKGGRVRRAPGGQTTVPSSAQTSGMTPAQQTALVNSDYENYLGRVPSASETSFYTNLLSHGTSPDQVAAYFQNSPEYKADMAAPVHNTLTQALISVPQLGLNQPVPSNMFNADGSINTASTSNYAPPSPTQIAAMGQSTGISLNNPKATTGPGAGAAPAGSTNAANPTAGDQPLWGGLYETPSGQTVNYNGQPVRRGGVISTLGGRLSRDMGGSLAGAGMMAAGIPGASGTSPMQQGWMSSFGNMSTEQLQEMSSRFPPRSPYGQMVRQVLQAKMMMPNGGQQAPAGLKRGGALRAGFDDGGSADTEPTDVALGGAGDSSTGAVSTADGSDRTGLVPGSWPVPVAISGLGAQGSDQTAIDQPSVDDVSPSVPILDHKALAPQTASAPTGTGTSGFDPLAGYVQPGHFKPLDAPNTPTFAQKIVSNPWLPVIQAGLAMAAGTSPFAMTNIARGLESGLQGYGAQSKQAQAAQDAADARQMKNDQIQRMNLDIDTAAKNLALGINKAKFNADQSTRQTADREAMQAQQIADMKQQAGLRASADARAQSAADRAQSDWEAPDLEAPVLASDGTSWVQYNNDTNSYQPYTGPTPKIPSNASNTQPVKAWTTIYDKTSGKPIAEHNAITNETRPFTLHEAPMPGAKWSDQYGWVVQGADGKWNQLQANH